MSILRESLELGWRVTPTFEPRYWTEGEGVLGAHSADDLVTVPSEKMLCHTALVAQSGSGKSFFLGRLIEELILRTHARVVVIDPNADFRRIHETEARNLWDNARYEKGRGRLPTERTRQQFFERWGQVASIRVRTASERLARRGKSADEPYELIRLPWVGLSMDFLAEDIEPMLRSDLFHCHDFVKDLAELRNLRDAEPIETKKLLDEAEKHLQRARTLPEEFRRDLETQFNVEELLKVRPGGISPPWVAMFFTRPPKRLRNIEPENLEWIRDHVRARVGTLLESLVRAPKYISQSVEHYYFSKARSTSLSDIVATHLNKPGVVPERAKRLEVIDLPSLRDKPTRLLVVNSLLAEEWNRARRSWNFALQRPPARDMRVPTFIVVDEAHNLIPADTQTKAEITVREQFRAIVAEGRKYGLFLVLVSQRPDKLDPLVLSECENRALMRLSSGAVLEKTKALLGLDEVQPKVAERCLDFQLGRALLFGHWAGESGCIPLYAAARRTVEGGRNLREEHWTTTPNWKPKPKKRKSRGGAATRR